MKNFDLEICAKELIKTLKERDNLFETFNILVPSKSLEDYFKNYWLKSYNGVLMNVNFYTFETLKKKLFNNAYLISNDQYKLLTCTVIEENLNKINLVSKYLDENEISYQNKLYDLATTLVSLFNDYDKDLLDLDEDCNEIKKLVLEKANKLNLFTTRYIIENFNFKNIGTIHSFGFVNYSKLEESLLNKYNKVLHYDLDSNVNFKKTNTLVSKCPSKKKEIEILHSKICNLLLKNDNKYSDFLVLSSNISDYAMEIKAVFEQDNKNFLSIPYNIKTRLETKSDTYALFDILFASLSNNSFTRLDLNNILNIEWVTKSRNISKDDVCNIIDMILKTNVYNDIDIDKLKNRLILSKFANIDNFDNSFVSLNDKEYVPYSNMSLNNDLMLKFLDLITDVSSFLSFFNTHKIIKKDNLEELEKVINRLVLYNEKIEEENYELFKINKFINSLKTLDINNLHYIIFKNFVLDILKNSNNTKSGLNIGVTFDSFNKDIVNKYKYVFFIGLSSNNFPNLTVTSELDLRNESDEYEEIKKSFYLTKLNSENFYISYEAQNLKSGEEYYPSIILNELFIVEEETITIDEKREYKELFTRSEFKNKGYDISLYTDTNEISKKKNLDILYKPNDYPKTIDIKKFSDFLIEPFSFKTKQIFPYNDDSYSKIEEEFSPYKMDILDSFSIFDDLIPYVYEHQLTRIQTEKLYKYYLLTSKIPSVDEKMSKVYFYEFLDTICEQINLVHEKNTKLSILEDVELKIDNANLVVSSLKSVFVKEENNELMYIDLVNVNSVSLKHYLRLYVKTLLDVSSKSENEYNIRLVLIDKKLKQNSKYAFVITPSESKETLVNIFKNMYDYNNLFVLPFSFLEKDISNIDTFFEKLKEELKYFEDQKIFNKYTDFGYTYDNFETEFKYYKEEMKKLIKFKIESVPENEKKEE